MPSRHYSSSALNTDPGVYEPGDPFKPNFSDYPDQDDFVNQVLHHADKAYLKESFDLVDEGATEQLDSHPDIISGSFIQAPTLF